MADKWSVYGQLVKVEHERGQHESAFDVSERMRARQMLDQLSRGRIEAPELPPDLASEEQDLRRRLTELAREGETETLHPLARRETASLAEPRRSGEELSRAQGAYARLLGRIREASPAYANLVSGATVSFSEARSRLRQGELLLDYLVMDSTTIVFALTAEGLRSFEVPLPRRCWRGWSTSPEG